MGDRVVVAVRVRPMNKREADLGSQVIVEMEENQTILYHPKSSKSSKKSRESATKYEPKAFTFDYSFWSIDESNSAKFCDQKKIFECLGVNILERAFEGYNACILAYGQTGSGKSYTMMGSHEQKGIIPRFCDSLFDRISSKQSQSSSFRVQASYMEIYNEKVRDLLDPGSKHSLMVREHSVLGPYVDGLLQLAVKSYQEIQILLAEGTKSRTVAATNMNSESSRSHAVLTVTLVHALMDQRSGTVTERVSRISLVDLAGSERASKTGSIGERLREGGNINRSLTTLGLVVKALAEQGGRHHAKFVPYRDSVLTWLLKDNLGGNSKTVMLALVSPAGDNYEESLSTLRYADSAKCIVNHAVVNEDPNARMIRELRKEVEQLRLRLLQAEGLRAVPNLKERLDESEKLMSSMCKPWEERLLETERIRTERQSALEDMGIHVETSGIKVDAGRCFLVNLNADPSLNELLVYYLKDHTRIGRSEGSSIRPDIQLDGVGIMPDHCTLDIEESMVFITPLAGARTCVNGVAISCRMRVKHGDRILWGNNHFFRLSCPKGNDSDYGEPEDAKTVADYNFAQEELMQQEMAADPVQGIIEHMKKQLSSSSSTPAGDQIHGFQNQKSGDEIDVPGDGLIDSPGFQDKLSPLRDDCDALSSDDGLPGSSANGGARKEKKMFADTSRRKRKGGRHAVDSRILSQLKKDLYRAHSLAREANMLARSLPWCDVKYEVSLQIPASELSPNRRQSLRKWDLQSKPAIIARREGHADQKQLFTADEFDDRLVAMRDVCLGRKDTAPKTDEGGPFDVTNSWHDLIGVANVFLDALFHDVAADLWVAIVSQYGEVSGRLHVILSKKGDDLACASDDETEERSDDYSYSGLTSSPQQLSKRILIKVTIKEAKDLPSALANFVFCQYNFWDHTGVVIVPPAIPDLSDEDAVAVVHSDCTSVVFNHVKEFMVSITDDFVDHISCGNALSIQVYGHRATVPTTPSPVELCSSLALATRWAEVTCQIELRVEILEPNDVGEYETVELRQKADVLCGGVFQLRQGYSRRLRISVIPLPGSGQLPLMSLSIESVCIGGICLRSQQQRGLDSYHEQGLELLRTRWRAALDRRRAYLSTKTASTKMSGIHATETDASEDEAQNSLKSLWDELICEMDAVCTPAPGSGVPGAPNTSSVALLGSEQHVPVIFLDLDAPDEDQATSNELFDSSSDDDGDGSAAPQAVGEQWLLDREEGTTFLQLPLVQHTEGGDGGASAVASWDSSLHESIHLNTTTLPNERVYLTVKAYLRLRMHPEPRDVVLRKRVCVSIYRMASLSDKLRRSLGAPRTSPVIAARGSSPYAYKMPCSSCSIKFDVISTIPKALRELESGEALARLAVASNGMMQEETVLDDKESHHGSSNKDTIAIGKNKEMSAGNESYIEQYLQNIVAIESVIAADKAAQDAAIRESLRLAGRPLRRFGSSPSISGVSRSSRYLFSPRGEVVTPPLMQVRQAMSVRDLSSSSRSRSTLMSGGRFLRQTFAAENLSELPALPSYPSEEPAKSTAGDVRTTLTVAYGKKTMNTGTLSNIGSLQASAVRSPASRLSFLSCVGIPKSDDDDAYLPVSLSEKQTSFCDISQPAAVQRHRSQAGICESRKEHDFSLPLEQLVLHENVNENVHAANCYKTSLPQDFRAQAETSGAALPSLEDSNGASAVSSENRCLVTEEAPSIGRISDRIAEDEPAPLALTENTSRGCAIDSFSAPLAVVQEPADGKLSVVAHGLAAVSQASSAAPSLDGTNNDASIPSVPVLASVRPAEASVLPICAVFSPLCADPVSQSRESEQSVGAQDPEEARLIEAAITMPTRLELLSDMYSVNALDDLEAFKTAGADNVSDGFDTDDEVGDGSRCSANLTSPTTARCDASFTAFRSAVSPPVRSNSDDSDGSSTCSFGSVADLIGSNDDPPPSWLRRGINVIVLSTTGKPPRTGTVQSIGETVIAPGIWAGVQLQEPLGKNDGSVRGVRYFRCPSGHGIFARPDRLLPNRKDKAQDAGGSWADASGNAVRQPNALEPAAAYRALTENEASIAAKPSTTAGSIVEANPSARAAHWAPVDHSSPVFDGPQPACAAVNTCQAVPRLSPQEATQPPLTAQESMSEAALWAPISPEAPGLDLAMHSFQTAMHSTSKSEMATVQHGTGTPPSKDLPLAVNNAQTSTLFRTPTATVASSEKPRRSATMSPSQGLIKATGSAQSEAGDGRGSQLSLQVSASSSAMSEDGSVRRKSSFKKMKVPSFMKPTSSSSSKKK